MFSWLQCSKVLIKSRGKKEIRWNLDIALTQNTSEVQAYSDKLGGGIVK